METPATATLMSKWKTHYEQRDFRIKPENIGYLGVVIGWCFALINLAVSLRVLLPVITEREQSPWMYGLTAFLFVEASANWLLSASKSNSEVRKRSTPVDPAAAGWHLCTICQLQAPPRSHHCKLCKRCVLKRDHHCFFTGACIGFHNQRRFLVHVTYVAATSLFLMYQVLAYLGETMPLLSTEHGFTYLPMVALYRWVIGTLDSPHALLLLLLYGQLACLLSAAVFAVLGLMLVWRGQTSYEATYKVTTYRGATLADNFRSVFGPYWLLSFFVPLPSAQLGDGYEWQTSKAIKGS